MKLSSRFRGCIIGGAIGDAYGSGYEFQQKKKINVRSQIHVVLLFPLIKTHHRTGPGTIE